MGLGSELGTAKPMASASGIMAMLLPVLAIIPVKCLCHCGELVGTWVGTW